MLSHYFWGFGKWENELLFGSARSAFQPEAGAPAEHELADVIKPAGERLHPVCGLNSCIPTDGLGSALLL